MLRRTIELQGQVDVVVGVTTSRGMWKVQLVSWASQPALSTPGKPIASTIQTHRCNPGPG